MEPKVIIYIVMAVGYFIYSAMKKAQEKKAAAPETPTDDKPVTPPVAKPLQDLIREMQQREAQKQAAAQKPKPVQSFQPKKPEKEILIHQKQKGVFAEGNYERDLTDEEKIERGKLKIENEGIYKIKSVEQMEEEENASAFQLDVRNAIIGSIILERKF